MSEENAPYNAGHDPTVTLRLELGRMTDKANALEAALRKEVLAIVAQEVAKAKACDAEIAKLKAEVERLEGLVKYWQIEAETDHAHWVRHAEANELLRKAGDAMVKVVVDNGCHDNGDWKEVTEAMMAWQQAKEGKPSV